jgi:hypothetical protein
VGAEGTAEAQNGMWKEDGYGPRRKGDIGFMPRLLYRRGKGELVGRRLRGLSLRWDQAAGGGAAFVPASSLLLVHYLCIICENAQVGAWLLIALNT